MTRVSLERVHLVAVIRLIKHLKTLILDRVELSLPKTPLELSPQSIDLNKLVAVRRSNVVVAAARVPIAYGLYTKANIISSATYFRYAIVSYRDGVAFAKFLATIDVTTLHISIELKLDHGACYPMMMLLYALTLFVYIDAWSLNPPRLVHPSLRHLTISVFPGVVNAALELMARLDMPQLSSVTLRIMGQVAPTLSTVVDAFAHEGLRYLSWVDLWVPKTPNTGIEHSDVPAGLLASARLTVDSRLESVEEALAVRQFDLLGY